MTPEIQCCTFYWPCCARQLFIWNCILLFQVTTHLSAHYSVSFSDKTVLSVTQVLPQPPIMCPFPSPCMIL